LVPFILIALILEEIIPLIVLYAPSMLPSTCILPSQRDRIQEKAMDQALKLMTDYKHVLMSITRAADGGEIPLRSLSGQDVTKVICGFVLVSFAKLK
jgi:LETM1 and EF-hand domain-containing protein 1